MPSSPENEDTGDGGAVAQADQEAEQRDEGAQQLAEMEDRWKRALADLENYRRRTARDTDRRVTERSDALIRDWLETVDSVERALAMEPENPVASGLRAVLEQMEAVLARQGVERVGRVGEPFDPERHEAVGVQETNEVPDRTITEVARSGYARDGRILRPAQAIVSRAPAGDG